MQTEQELQPTDYARAVAALVAELSLERAAQVYDFVRFLQSQPSGSLPTLSTEEDWLNDSEEQMQIEDALWAAVQARHHDKFTALAAAARGEIDANKTEPMFDENGEWLLP